MHPGDEAVIRELERQIGIKIRQRSDPNFIELSGYLSNEAGRVVSLTIDHKNLKDVSPLESLTALTHLGLTRNQIQDVLPLTSLSALTNLDLHSNQIQDLSPH